MNHEFWDQMWGRLCSINWSKLDCWLRVIGDSHPIKRLQNRKQLKQTPVVYLYCIYYVCQGIYDVCSQGLYYVIIKKIYYIQLIYIIIWYDMLWYAMIWYIYIYIYLYIICVCTYYMWIARFVVWFLLNRWKNLRFHGVLHNRPTRVHLRCDLTP